MRGAYAAELDIEDAVAAAGEERTIHLDEELAGAPTSNVGTQAVADIRHILQRRYAYDDPNNTHFVLTVTGEDRAGILSELGTVIHHHGGNVVNAKQISMADEFALMMVVSLRRENAPDLNAHFHSIQNIGHFSSRDLTGGTTAVPPAPKARTFSFMLSGPDAPGIVSDAMRTFSETGLTVRSLQSELFDEAQPRFVMSGEVMLSADPQHVAHQDKTEAQVREALEVTARKFELSYHLESQAHA
eukprot:COSAG01_NODE_5646_length_4119_cov_7.726119_4_plen_244_part_00